MAVRVLWIGIVILFQGSLALAGALPTTLDNVVVFAKSKLNLISYSELTSGQVLVGDTAGVAAPGRYFRALQDTQIIADNVNVIAGRTSKPQFFDVFTNSLTAPHGYTLQGTLNTVTLPLFTFPTAPVITFGTKRCPTPGRIAGDCLIRGGTPVLLEPGDYRKLIVRSRAHVSFAGGTYNFKSVTGGLKSTFIFNGTSTVNVAERASFGVGSVIGPISQTELNGRCITINIAGDRVRFLPFTDVNATVSAPNADMNMRGYSVYRGNFVGQKVTVGWAATIEAAPALTAACP